MKGEKIMAEFLMLNLNLNNALAENKTQLICVLIVVVCMIIFKSMSRQSMKYKRIKFEILHDLRFMEDVYLFKLNLRENIEKYKTAAKTFEEEAERLNTFAENLPESSFLTIGVPDREKLFSAADDLMLLSGYTQKFVDNMDKTVDYSQENKEIVDRIRKNID